MKKLLFLSALATVAGASYGQFTLDNLVVLRAGDGATALTSGSTAVTLEQFTQAGSFVNTTSFTNLTLSGTAASEGALYNYGAGISFGAYGVAPGTASLPATTSAAVVRNAVVVDFATASTSSFGLTAAPNPFNSGNIRSVALNGIPGPSNVPTRAVAIGSNTGVVNSSLSGVSQVASTTTANIRSLQVSGDDVFYSTGSGTQGVYRVAGGATGNGLTASLVFATGGGSIYDFQKLENGDYIYADDGSGATGGLRRWSAATNTVSTIAAPSIFGTSVSVRQFVTRGNSVFATTTETNNNRIVRIDFSGADFTGTATVSDLAFAGTNRAFRGIEAVPEPATMAALGLGILGLARRRRNK
jgi:hypothetical protein